MTVEDFEDALRGRLARNEEFEQEREARDEQLERRLEERREAERERREEQRRAREAHHADLVESLQGLVAQLEETVPESVVARGGWTESGEEYVVKLSSVQLRPRRSLLIELDRDDDEVLARWTSTVGRSVEMWTLTDFTTDMLEQLVLDLVDQEAWHAADGPPAFPGTRDWGDDGPGFGLA